MHCGCPVVVSRRSALPEICGEAAAYCDPGSPADIAQQLRRVITSLSLQQELREAGFVRAAQFSWKHAAARLEELLRSGPLGAPA
jgi:glycosyltransferase involved in cell wall biosynthesis